jgi:hypothetical protein
MNKRLEERLKVDPILREAYPKLLAIPLKEVHIELKGKLAQAARANPDNVRIHIRDADGNDVVGRGVLKLVEVKP